MIVFVDSSVVLRAILRDGPLLSSWNDIDLRVASRLALVESKRTLHRFVATGAHSEQDAVEARDALAAIEADTRILDVDRMVLDVAAGSFPVPVRTLDAIHLATAMLYREVEREPELVFATHDARQARAAALLGLMVAGVERS